MSESSQVWAAKNSDGATTSGSRTRPPGPAAGSADAATPPSDPWSGGAVAARCAAARILAATPSARPLSRSPLPGPRSGPARASSLREPQST
ncbi:hypothetical protein ABZY34_20385 [Streptomyces virginiae]|uniref:hypothetical protein n=1 Tax=Streptomyces virginiae TaxID=1961 RepID=UPI0033BA7B31